MAAPSPNSEFLRIYSYLFAIGSCTICIGCYRFKVVIGCLFCRTSPHISDKCWLLSKPFFQGEGIGDQFALVACGVFEGMNNCAVLRFFSYTAGDEQLPISYPVPKG